MDITYRMELNAPIERAFSMVDDDRKARQWMNGLKEIIYTFPYNRQNPVGMKFKQRIREGVRMVEYDGEIIAYDKPRHLGLRIGNRQLTIQVDYRFSTTGEGTELEYSSRTIRAGRGTLLMERFFGWVAQRLIERRMRTLKKLAEKDA